MEIEELKKQHEIELHNIQKQLKEKDEKLAQIIEERETLSNEHDQNQAQSKKHELQLTNAMEQFLFIYLFIIIFVIFSLRDFNFFLFLFFSFDSIQSLEEDMLSLETEKNKVSFLFFFLS